MAFEWEKNAEVAECLLKAEIDEQAKIRACISRSYYSCCHLAKNKSTYAYAEEGSWHLMVARYFANHNNRSLRLIGKKLESLRKRRNEADYDAEVVFDVKDGEKALRDASDIIKMLKKI